MGEVRTTSTTGGQKGVKPERFSLMPRKGLAAISRVFAFGAQKYADHNWRRGYEWSKSLDALERHFQAFKDGETLDLCDDDCEHLSETGDRTCRNHSGLPHLAHAGFHVLVLLTWLEDQGEGADNPFDDRWPAGMERARREAAEELRLLAEAADELRLLAEAADEPEVTHIPRRYVPDVPSGTGDLTDLPAPIDVLEEKAAREGLTVEKAIALHDLTLPFPAEAVPDEGFATVWIQSWGPSSEIPTEDLRF